LNALQWNALAIVLVLVVLPFAVAFVSNLGSSEGNDFKDGIDNSKAPTGAFGGFWWNNGGENYSSQYSGIGSCGYVVDYNCIDSGFNYPLTGYGALAMPVNSLDFEFDAVAWPQTHYRISDAGNEPYAGYSGDGPFEWFVYGATYNAIENNNTFDRLKFGFFDESASYNCESHNWVNLSIEQSITFHYQGKNLTYNSFITETDNKQIHYPFPNFHETCIVGFEILYDFSSFEALELVNWNGGNWDQTNYTITIEKISQPDNPGNVRSTQLPFAGNGYFLHTMAYSPIDEVSVNFFINIGTLVLAIATFAVGIASTPYWDPFKNTFRGIQ